MSNNYYNHLKEHSEVEWSEGFTKTNKKLVSEPTRSFRGLGRIANGHNLALRSCTYQSKNNRPAEGAMRGNLIANSLSRKTFTDRASMESWRETTQ
jgi:hypothetical protein